MAYLLETTIKHITDPVTKNFVTWYVDDKHGFTRSHYDNELGLKTCSDSNEIEMTQEFGCLINQKWVVTDDIPRTHQLYRSKRITN